MASFISIDTKENCLGSKSVFLLIDWIQGSSPQKLKKMKINAVKL